LVWQNAGAVVEKGAEVSGQAIQQRLAEGGQMPLTYDVYAKRPVSQTSFKKRWLEVSLWCALERELQAGEGS